LKVITYFIIANLLFLFACQSKVQRPEPILKETKNVTASGPNTESYTKSNSDPLSSESVATRRAQALAILNFRLKNDPDYYTVAEEGVWETQFVHSRVMSKPGEYDGVWIDFKKDHTYEYGKYKEIHGSGKYNYHFERGEILMIDDDKSKKPEEWEIKSSGDVMIMVGTATYSDNHIQKKLVNHPDSFRQ